MTLAETDGCYTSEGFIPHKRIALRDGTTLRAPVAVTVEPAPNGHSYQQRPRRDWQGRLLYVLPGGHVIR